MSVVELQMPRVLYAPEYTSSAGAEAIELAAMAGLVLDPWEALVLDVALAEGDDGRWAAAEVGVCVPRQNGKNAILEARELAGLFLLDERLIIQSAQHFKTAKEHFRRLLSLVESTPDLDRRVSRVIRAHGEEGIELRDGSRILFVARTRSSGRGFSAPLVVFDEAMYLAEAAIGALVPTQSAMRNRQRWYTGSAVDQLVHADGVVFARVRERALQEKDPRLAYFEWSLDAERPELIDDAQLVDEDAWASVNPGFGIRISAEAITDELRTLDPRTFAVERLGVGDWPATSDESESVISLDRWAELLDETSELLAALKGAVQRPLGDAWAWSRKSSSIDICPLVAATLALWGASSLGWDPNSDPVIW